MRLSRILLAAFSAIAIVSFAAAVAQTPTVTLVDRVEEDWKVVVTNPDVAGCGPQITTCMSPVSDGSTPFVAFDVNYREFPSFAAGGMQLQVWSGGNILSTATVGTSQFATPNEIVTWTQSMAISAGTISYDILTGRSTTWGRFGQGNGNLAVTYPTTLTDLSLTYSPDISANKSGVTWQANFVNSMTLLQVRYYSGGTLVATDSVARPVALANH